jgi:hypothetical protein
MHKAQYFRSLFMLHDVYTILLRLVATYTDKSSSQEIPRLLQNPKVHYHAQKSRPEALCNTS